MRRIFFALVLLLAAPAAAQSVVVNGTALSSRQLVQLVRVAGTLPRAGRYWYDARCGVWGLEGHGAAGLLPAGLPYGEPRPDASRGTSGVFVNGRQLTRTEVAELSRLGPVVKGRYWLNADGTFGLEGGPALGNLAAAARQNRAGKPRTWRSKNTDIGVGSDGHGGVYVIGDGWSYSSF